MNHFERRLYHKLFYEENYPAKDISGLLFIFGRAYIRRGLCTEGNLCFKIDWASLWCSTYSPTEVLTLIQFDELQPKRWQRDFFVLLQGTNNADETVSNI